MQIFIDTADIEEIQEAFSWGIVDGVTTNPSLIKKAAEKYSGMNLEDYLVEILKKADNKPVSIEVIGGNADEIYSQGMKLHAKYSKHSMIVVKVPVNAATETAANHFSGLNAISRLAQKNIPVNATLIMSPEQALLAAKAGAVYVSPFAGRIDDLLRHQKGDISGKDAYFPRRGILKDKKALHDNGILSGVHLVESIVNTFRIQKIKVLVLAASIRNSRQAREVALAGADIATLPFAVLREMAIHPKTFEGMVSFTKDIGPEYKRVFD